MCSRNGVHYSCEGLSTSLQSSAVSNPVNPPWPGSVLVWCRRSSTLSSITSPFPGWTVINPFGASRKVIRLCWYNVTCIYLISWLMELRSGGWLMKGGVAGWGWGWGGRQGVWVRRQDRRGEGRGGENNFIISSIYPRQTTCSMFRLSLLIHIMSPDSCYNTMLPLGGAPSNVWIIVSKFLGHQNSLYLFIYFLYKPILSKCCVYNTITLLAFRLKFYKMMLQIIIIIIPII